MTIRRSVETVSTSNADDAAFLRLEGPNLWPTNFSELQPTITRWTTELNALALRLLRAWALALGASENVVDVPSIPGSFVVKIG